MARLPIFSIAWFSKLLVLLLLCGDCVAAGYVPPVAVMTVSAQVPDTLKVLFDGTPSTAGGRLVAAYEWNFGDGKTGQGSKPAHVYTQAGTYAVTLKVTDKSIPGASSSITTNVIVYPMPVAAGSATLVGGTYRVLFDGSASSASGATLTDYAWSFADPRDPTEAHGVMTSHTYGGEDWYEAKLTVTDSRGNHGSKKFLFKVPYVPPINQAPTASLRAVPVAANRSYNFDAAGSADPDGTIVRYDWSFGDGSAMRSNQASASHQYAQAGVYTATLVVTDNSGATSAPAGVTLTAGVGQPQPNPSPWVTGYYAGWDWNGYQPQHVDMSALTHVVFGRVAPGGGTLGGQQGEVVYGAGTARDAGLLLPLTNASAEDFLIARAHQAGVKALLMVGGVADGQGFMASTGPSVRATFIANLVDYLVAHQYDGIDIDWEDELDSAAAQQQLLALLSELRSAANAHPYYQAPHAPVVLTFPNYALNMNTDMVAQWKVAAAALVDQYNLMSYGMAFDADGWSTWHFSAIRGQDVSHPMDLSSSIDAYINAGVPRNKLGIGIGFYGMNFALPSSGPGQPRVATQDNDTEFSYANLINHGFLSHGVYHWDAEAGMGYRSYEGGYTGTSATYQGTVAGYISYEDPASITAKGAWARESGLGGAILWTINHGSPDGIRNPLLSAAKRAFLQGELQPFPFAVFSTSLVAGSYQVGFDASASSDGYHAADAIVRYDWDFGDGHSASGVNPSHTYEGAGSRMVTLTVVDQSGLSAASTVAVTLQEPLPPDTTPPLVPVPSSRGAKPWVTGYYAGWFWDSYPVDKIMMDAMTHVVFGRLAPGGGTLGGNVGELVYGAGTAGQAGILAPLTDKSVEDYLIERTHAAGNRALLMLGGVGDGPAFLAATAPAVRPVFVANVLNYLAAHDYDGIDVDWEDELDTGVAQTRALTLVADLRAAAAAHPRYQQKGIIITFPNYALNMNTDSISPASWKVTMAAIVDQYNLMSYQMSFDANGWTTGHFCAIYGQNPTHPMDLDSSLAAYVTAGVDRKKLGIGIGFYGMSFAPPATGPDQPTTALRANDVEWSYANLVNGGFLSHGAYHWDDAAKMGYRSYSGGYSGTVAPYQAAVAGYLSYEDAASILAKGQYVRQTEVGGTILWTINYGSPDRISNPLLQAVKDGFLK